MKEQQKKGLLWTLAVALWSLVMKVMVLCLQLCAPFSKSLQRFVAQRKLQPELLIMLAAQRQEASTAYVFFCSSAGEYEQSLPLIAEFRKREPRSYALIVMFSPSGMEFARARKEQNTYILAPFDDIAAWKKLFAVLQPKASFVLCHELWPGFLWVARCWGRGVFLVNANFSAHSSAWSVRSKLALLSLCSGVFLRNEDDAKLFSSWTKRAPCPAYVVGDTKYDRVWMRAEHARNSSERYRQLLGAGQWQGAFRITLGSAWPPDAALALRGLRMATDAVAQLQLVLVPHRTDAAMITEMQELAQANGFSARLFSELEAGQESAAVVIVDRLGILLELYDCTALAMIGGAMDHKVHNALEAAIFGAPVAFGPRYTNSIDAERLVAESYARVLQQPEDFAKWVSSFAQNHEDFRLRLSQRVRSFTGASLRVVEFIQ